MGSNDITALPQIRCQSPRSPAGTKFPTSWNIDLRTIIHHINHSNTLYSRNKSTTILQTIQFTAMAEVPTIRWGIVGKSIPKYEKLALNAHPQQRA